MRFLVFPYDSSTLLRSLRYSLKINVDLAQNVVIRERVRKARIYTDGGYEEYEIAHITELAGNKYYIAGRLLEQSKPDYLKPVRNEFEEVAGC